MLLRNVVIVGSNDGLPNDLLVENGRIGSILPTGTLQTHHEKTETIEFTNAIAFPGLINSHEHLDFNLFPQVANKIYPNYREWGNDIHKQNKPTINEVLQVPQSLRTQWGIYKNLLNGFTSVVNHGDKLAIEDNLIHVHQKCISLHSVGFEKNWKWKLNRPSYKRTPFVIHIGEGTDETACKEIDELIRWNIFKKTLIGIHGVAMKPNQASHFKALVWCPASNYFLLNRTADIISLKRKTGILFGSDSALTAGWNIWEQIHTARKTKMLSDTELFQSITGNAADIWGWERKGYLKEGFTADIVIARNNGNQNALDAFYAVHPEDILLVMKDGKIRMYDISLEPQLNQSDWQSPFFSSVTVNGSTKWVTGELPVLMQQIKQYYPGAFFLPVQ